MKEINKEKIENNLTPEEHDKKKSLFRLKGGFRKAVKRANAINDIFNKLCTDCRKKAYYTVFSNPRERMNILSDLSNYCDDCRSMIKDIENKLQ